MKAAYIYGNLFPTTWDDYVSINKYLPNVTINANEIEEEISFDENWVDIDIREPLLTQEKATELLLMICQDINSDITEIELVYSNIHSI